MASKATDSVVPEAARAPQIDWGQWNDGDWWRLQRGVDHEQPPRDAVRAARMWAMRNGRKVECRLPEPGADNEPWLIRFTDRERPPLS